MAFSSGTFSILGSLRFGEMLLYQAFCFDGGESLLLDFRRDSLLLISVYCGNVVEVSFREDGVFV